MVLFLQTLLFPRAVYVFSRDRVLSPGSVKWLPEGETDSNLRETPLTSLGGEVGLGPDLLCRLRVLKPLGRLGSDNRPWTCQNRTS